MRTYCFFFLKDPLRFVGGAMVVNGALLQLGATGANADRSGSMAERWGYKREALEWATVVGARPKVRAERSAPEDLQKAAWLAAMRWRRAVQSEAIQVGITFTQWLVLDAIRQLFEETGDASIQNEIAARTELDRATISQVVRALDRKKLVDRGIDIVGSAWRTLLTERAVSILADLQPKIRAVSSVP